MHTHTHTLLGAEFCPCLCNICAYKIQMHGAHIVVTLARGGAVSALRPVGHSPLAAVRRCCWLLLPSYFHPLRRRCHRACCCGPLCAYVFFAPYPRIRAIWWCLQQHTRPNWYNRKHTHTSKHAHWSTGIDFSTRKRIVCIILRLCEKLQSTLIVTATRTIRLGNRFTQWGRVDLGSCRGWKPPGCRCEGCTQNRGCHIVSPKTALVCLVHGTNKSTGGVERLYTLRPALRLLAATPMHWRSWCYWWYWPLVCGAAVSVFMLCCCFHRDC